MKFESNHSLSENEFHVFSGRDNGFPLHLHRSFELYAQLEGSAEVSVDGNKYTLTPGKAVLIFPFQIHSYCVSGPNLRKVCIFSPDLVPDFYAGREQCVPQDSVFTIDLPDMMPLESIFLKRSFAYRVCGEFDLGRRYVPKNSSLDPSVLTELLLYAEKNYRSPCLLRDAAADIGYDYAYLSKFFKRQTGIPFRQYVNMLRIRESQKLLTQTGKSIDAIREHCGYGSLRSFDREFSAIIGHTPSEYRKNFQQKADEPKRIDLIV